MKPLIACVAAIVALVSTVSSADTALVKKGDIVVTDADFLAYMERVPPGLRLEAMADGERNNKVVDLLFTNRALSQEARQAGIDKDPVIARRLQQHQEAFLAQLYVSHLERTAKLPVTSEARAKELYLARTARYTEPDRINLQHILVSLACRTKEAALARANEIRARAQGGENFLTLAKEVSDAPTIKQDGGELGAVTAKELDDRLAQAAFRLKADGEISPPIETNYGYHLVKRVGFQPSYKRKFEDVKDAIIEEEDTRLRSDVSIKHLDSLRRNPETKWSAQAIDALRTEIPRAELERKQREALEKRASESPGATSPAKAAPPVPPGRN